MGGWGTGGRLGRELRWGDRIEVAGVFQRAWFKVNRTFKSDESTTNNCKMLHPLLCHPIPFLCDKKPFCGQSRENFAFFAILCRGATVGAVWLLRNLKGFSGLQP